MSGKTYAMLYCTLGLTAFVLTAWVTPAMNAHVAAQLKQEATQ